MRNMALTKLLVLSGALWLACGTEPEPIPDADPGRGAEPPVLLTTSVVDGVVGVPYLQRLAARGGVPPLSWSLRNVGEQLAWLGINAEDGTLSGVPTVPTSQPFDVRVRDTTGQEASRTFTLTISACREGETASCYFPSDTACMSGQMTCQNGRFGVCVMSGPSQDVRNCGVQGSACGRCGTESDRCGDGKCRCGDSAPCTGPASTCCTTAQGTGRCADTQTDPDFCGGCNQRCDEDRVNVKRQCVGGTCSYACQEGFARCAPNLDDPSCSINLQTDENNCGGCGNSCSVLPPNTQLPSNSSERCQGGLCQHQCVQGFTDCDPNRLNGCETHTAGDVNNCGGCGIQCPGTANGTPVCNTGQCGIECNRGFKPCGKTCVSETDTNYCASCQPCRSDLPHVSMMECASGVCRIKTCAWGWRDCNGSLSDGCEQNVLSDSQNCGACGRTCEVGSGCMEGSCGQRCSGNICLKPQICTTCWSRSCANGKPICRRPCCRAPGEEDEVP